MRGLRATDIAALITANDVRVAPGGHTVAWTETTINHTENRYETGLFTETDGAGAQRVTSSELTVGLPRWSPDGTRIALTSRSLLDDDAVTTIAILDVASGSITTVCTPPEGPSELEWSPDGTRLAFVARDPDLDYYAPPGGSRKARDTPARKIATFYTRLDGEGWLFDRPARIFVVDAATDSAAAPITDRSADTSEISWSPDGTRIVAASARHHTWDIDLLRDLWVIDTTDGSLRALTANDAMYSLPQWSPDATRIAAMRYSTPMSGPRHNQVVVFDETTGERSDLTNTLDRNCTPAGANRMLMWDGADHLVFAYEDHGRAPLARVDTATATIETLVDGDVCVTDFDVVDGTLATVQSGPTTLGEVHIRPLITTTEQRTLVTERVFGAVGASPAEPIAFSATSSDGVEVDCWAMRPDGDGPFPAILNIHGGPFTQYTRRVFDEFQIQVAAGFAVVYCNPRGSAGGTEAWGRAVRWPECAEDPGTGWGGIDYDDVMACIDTAVEQFAWIDPERVGVQGGSYGGYLTTWIVGHTDRFKAACSERSVNNLVTEEHNSDVASSFVEQIGASHLDAPEAYARQSPITYVRDITTPMLIIHSEDDFRCPISQAEELFVALRLLGRTPEFWRFPGEGHELSRSGAPRHRVQRAEIIVDFFSRHLS